WSFLFFRNPPARQPSTPPRKGRIAGSGFWARSSWLWQPVDGFGIAPASIGQERAGNGGAALAWGTGEFHRVISRHLDALGAAGDQPDGRALAVPRRNALIGKAGTVVEVK